MNTEEIIFVALAVLAWTLLFTYLKRAKNRDQKFKLGTDMNKKEDVITLYFVIGMYSVLVFGVPIGFFLDINNAVASTIGLFIGFLTASRIVKSNRTKTHQ